MLGAELSAGHSAHQLHPGSMPPALLVHLQVQIKQKGQTGKSFAAGGHVLLTTPQPHVALWPAFPLAGMDTSHPSTLLAPQHLQPPASAVTTCHVAWMQGGAAAVSQCQVVFKTRVLFQVSLVPVVFL